MDIRDAFFGQVHEIMKSDKNVYFLTADMGALDLLKIREDSPDRFFNVGISEQNMISMASGLALQGKKVFTYTIGAFYQRAFEQIKLDICYMNLPVVMIAGCVGLSNATDGYTHYCINDISVMRTLPNLTIYNPCESLQAKFYAHLSHSDTSPCYIRLDKGDFKPYFNDIFTDTVIIATGNMVEIAMKVGVQVVNLSTLNPLDNSWLYCLIHHAKRIFTLEEHINTGLGSIISEFLTDNNLKIPLTRLGVTKVSPTGDRNYMQKLNGLDVESLKETICNSRVKTSLNALEGLPRQARG